MDDNLQQTVFHLIEDSGRAAASGEGQAVLDNLERARELDPVTVELELARRAWANTTGSADAISDRRKSVVERLGGVAVAQPERIDTWKLLAELLIELREYEGALHATAGGLKREPNSVALWVRRVRAQVQMGSLKSAAKSLRHLVRTAPTHDAVEALIRIHPVCVKCGALFRSAGAEACVMCKADGPGRGAPVHSVRMKPSSKFDIYFPRVRDVIAASLDMPDRIRKMLTLDTLLKRHLKRSNQQCSRVLRAMSEEFGAAFDAPLFKSAIEGFLDLLIADLIRAIDPRTDKTIDTAVRRRVSYE
ncbi:MAG: tetratricopeptide repeat protein [Planctomycetota bacterium]